MKDSPIFSVNDLISTIIVNAKVICRKNGSIDEKTVPGYEAFPRTTTGYEIIDAVFDKSTLNIERDAILESIREEIDKVLTDYGLEVRHLNMWLQKPVEDLCEQLNNMAYQNLLIRTQITRDDIKRVYREYDIDLEDEDLVSMKAFRDKFLEDSVDDSISNYDALEYICNEYGIDFSEMEISEINKKKSIDKTLEMLNDKLHSRNTNDCLVQYGRCWHRHNYEQSRDLYYETLGGVNNAANRLPVKHASDLFEVAGSTHGILTRVPEEQRTGRLKDAKAPVRIYLNTAGLSIRDYSNPFTMIADELKVLEKSEDSVSLDYYDFEEMLDDGWVLD